MGHLVSHLRAAIEKNKALETDLLGLEEQPITKHGGYLARIFQMKELSLSPEANSLFSQAILDLETQIKALSLKPNKETLSQLDAIIEALLKILKDEPEWQVLLAEIKNEKNRAAFERDISTAFMFKIITGFVIKNQHLKKEAEFIRIVANTRGQLTTRERLDRLKEKMPVLIRPTVCYFHGKGDVLKKDYTHFGHTAVGIRIEHDLILSGSPPPIPPHDSVKELEAYIAALPLDPDNNAYLVAEDRPDMILLSADNDSDLQESNLKTISRLNRNFPILIKLGDKFFVYGCKDEKWGLTPLIDLKETELAALKKLPYDDGKIKNNDPLLAALADTLKKGHTPKTQVYYLDKTRERLIYPLIQTTNQDFAAFKKIYLKEELPTRNSFHNVAKNLSFVDLQRLGSTLNHAPTEFLSYLSYGGSDTSVEAGVGTNSDFLNEKAIYGDQYTLITLPPCEAASFNKAQEEFAKQDRKKYKFLFQNCAHAVSQFMKTAGKLPNNEFIIDPTPRACAARAFQIVLNDLRQDREKILGAKDLSGTEKIRLLLKNDIRRLELQIQLDNINHLSSLKKPKWDKIDRLQNLLEDFNSAAGLSPNTLAKLIQAGETLGKHKTASHLQECLDCFPFEKLPVADLEKKRNLLIAMETAFKKYLPSKETAFRSLFPSSTGSKSAFVGFSPKEIYLLFHKLNKKLAEELEKPLTAELQNLYKNWYLKNGFTLKGVKLGPVSTPAPTKKAVQKTAANLDLSISGAFSFLQAQGKQKTNSKLAIPREATKPDNWYSVPNQLGSHYQYIKKTDPQIKTTLASHVRNLKIHLSKTEKITASSLKRPFRLEKDELRLSTHTLPCEEKTAKKDPLKFALLEKCLQPGEKINSQLILPKKQLTPLMLLQIIDHQIQESCKLLEAGKKPSITVRSLEVDGLMKSKKSLKPCEHAFIRYCLAMNLSCKALKDGKLISLDKGHMEALVPPAFDHEALRQKILAARSAPPTADDKKPSRARTQTTKI